MFITVNKVGEKSITGKIGTESYNVFFDQALLTQLNDIAKKAEDAETLEEIKMLQDEFREALKEAKDTGIMTELHKDLFYDSETGNYYLKANNRISKIPLPQALVDRIILSHEAGLDPTPVIKAWIRFLRNPNLRNITPAEFTSKVKRFARYITAQFLDHKEAERLVLEEGLDPAVAQERAIVNEVAITKEGLICTYKWSKEVLTKFDTKTGEQKDRYEGSFDEDSGEKIDGALPEFIEDRVFTPAMWSNGDKFACDGKIGYIMKVGSVVELPDWKMVNCIDSASCVKGLHVGNLTYIQYFGADDRVCHEVFVDPMDIGAITNDGTGALRVRRYFIHASFDRPQKQLYKSSTYAAEGDKVWEQMKKEAVEAKGVEDAKAATAHEEYINL